MSLPENFSTWLEIDLSAIRDNVRAFLLLTGREVMAIVKANAYGHGAVPVAKTAIQSGATWLGVSRIEEAIELRAAGIETRILILGYTPPEKIPTAIRNQISIACWNRRQIDLASECAQKNQINAKAHLKVDTGMSRLGAPPESAESIAEHIIEAPGVEFEGLFTHFACADEPNPAVTELQEGRFQELLNRLQKNQLLPEIIHISNSAAALIRPSSFFNMVRIGIAMYGLHPSKHQILGENFTPALTWKSVLGQVKKVAPGTGISYGHEYVTAKSELIGTIPVGYGDGYRRVKGNYVLAGGKRVPVVGRVCMDYIMVNLETAPDVKEGDEVVLIGSQNGNTISAEELAERWNTINYEIVCGLNARVARIYKNKDSLWDNKL